MTKMPKRIQLRRAKGWRMPENTLKCDRSQYHGRGNPFRTGIDGTAADCVHHYALLMAGYLCLTCKATLEDQKTALVYVKAYRAQMRGKNLGCWCHAGKPCHADVLLAFVNDGSSGCLNKFVIPDRGKKS